MESQASNALSTPRALNAFPHLVEQVVEEILQAESYPQVCYLMGRIMGAGHMDDLDSLTPAQITKIRAALTPLAAHSHVLGWALEKPYGYAGDFVALELLYDNEPSTSSTLLGKFLDRWLLNIQLGIGVRERKDMLSALIERKVKTHAAANAEPFNLLSLAAGSARELRDLSPGVLRNMNITLVDNDPRSLEFASNHLPENVDCVKRNALHLQASSLPHRFDLAYSFGFFDYLDDDQIVHCLNLCRSAIKPGGSVVFPLKLDRKFRHWFYDIFLDWRFVKREREDGLRLASQAELDVVELIETENESVLFYHCSHRKQ